MHSLHETVADPEADASMPSEQRKCDGKFVQLCRLRLLQMHQSEEKLLLQCAVTPVICSLLWAQAWKASGSGKTRMSEKQLNTC